MENKAVVIGPKGTKESAMRLAELLDADYISSSGTRTDFRGYGTVINYGSSRSIACNKVINSPASVKICINKISTLKRVAHGVEWTKDSTVALDWLKKDGAIVCRDREEGSKSEGVMIAYTKEGFNDCPAKFWTRYFDHIHEVRINVYKGKILSVYEKVTEDGFFDFRHVEVAGKHDQVDEMIVSITDKIGIDLYGMDVLVNKEGVARLLEVNSGASLMEATEPALIQSLKLEISANA